MKNLDTTTFLDAPVDWQIGFQDPASPIIAGIIHFHHHLIFFLFAIGVFLVWLLIREWTLYKAWTFFKPLNFKIKLNHMKNLYATTFLDALDWQIGFQDPASPITGGIVHFHNHLIFFSIMFGYFVVWLLIKVVWILIKASNLVPSKFCHSPHLDEKPASILTRVFFFVGCCCVAVVCGPDGLHHIDYAYCIHNNGLTDEQIEIYRVVGSTTPPSGESFRAAGTFPVVAPETLVFPETPPGSPPGSPPESPLVNSSYPVLHDITKSLLVGETIPLSDGWSVEKTPLTSVAWQTYCGDQTISVTVFKDGVVSSEPKVFDRFIKQTFVQWPSGYRLEDGSVFDKKS